VRRTGAGAYRASSRTACFNTVVMPEFLLFSVGLVYTMCDARKKCFIAVYHSATFFQQIQFQCFYFMQGSPALFSVMIKRRCSVYLRGLLCLLNLLLNEVIGSDGLVMVHVLQSLQLVMWLNVISFDVPSGRDNRSVASQVAVCSFL